MKKYYKIQAVCKGDAYLYDDMAKNLIGSVITPSGKDSVQFRKRTMSFYGEFDLVIPSDTCPKTDGFFFYSVQLRRVENF